MPIKWSSATAKQYMQLFHEFSFQLMKTSFIYYFFDLTVKK